MGASADDMHAILIVEDDRFNIRLLSDLCRTLNYRVRVAEDGQAGLDAIEAERPDLVLLDIMLPRLDGFEVLERLRADPRYADLPVIMVTAMQDAEVRLRCVDLGCDDFVHKPFRIGDLRARVESVLAQQRFRREL